MSDYLAQIIKQAIELRQLENGLAKEISNEFDVLVKRIQAVFLEHAVHFLQHIINFQFF